MSLGNAWTETTAGSASKLNTQTVVWGTGTYLATLDKTKHKILVCTSTGSGFTLDHVYLCSTDGTQAIDLSDINEHTHTNTTTGGSYTDILFNNTKTMDTGLVGLINLTADSTGLYRQSVTGTGAWSTQTDGTTSERYMEADTAATVSSTLSNHMPVNLGMDWTSDSAFEVKHKIQTATSLALKTGYGMENLAAADSNNRKYGAEICTTVNNNWFAASANGTTRSSSDTGVAMSDSKFAVSGFLYSADPKFELHVETGSQLYTKTSNIPTDFGANQPNRGAFFRYTVKNNTGASRKFNFYGCRLIYRVTDDAEWL